MAIFPTSAGEALMLANEMINGISLNPATFPSCNALTLTTARDNFVNANDAQQLALAAAQTRTTIKETEYDNFLDMMREQLNFAEGDTNNDPDKLALIGWAPRGTPTPQPLPGQPRALEVVSGTTVLLILDWKAPATGSGGKVSSYVVERAPTGIEDWTNVGNVVASEITIINPQAGAKFRYRVKAINLAGESLPSNAVEVFV